MIRFGDFFSYFPEICDENWKVQLFSYKSTTGLLYIWSPWQPEYVITVSNFYVGYFQPCKFLWNVRRAQEGEKNPQNMARIESGCFHRYYFDQENR